MDIHSAQFGEDFYWGVAASAYQTEGACLDDGKGPSIWDLFTQRKGAIRSGATGMQACDFYQRYIQDVILMEFLGVRNFRFSMSWPRLLPQAGAVVNEKGIEFYQRLIDFCLECNITPWVTLYHWDLPQALEDRGGWTNRDVVNRFADYAALCMKRFGDRVKHWMVLNEPMAFTGAGYFLGVHAPGRKGLSHFLPAVHHAALCQAEGIRLLQSFDATAMVGTTFSCAPVDPADESRLSVEAAQRVDVFSNRLFVEPLLGFGYPWQQVPALQGLQRYMRDGDEQRLRARPDFLGLQNYTREVAAHSGLVPYVNARLLGAGKRAVPVTDMDWEIYPAGIYRMLKRFAAYPTAPPLVITENGAAFADSVVDDRVHDAERIRYFNAYLQQVLRAKQEGVDVRGYFAWSFTDNFEWAEGYDKRFGLVYVDYATQKRIVKDSGFWFQAFWQTSQAYAHAG